MRLRRVEVLLETLPAVMGYVSSELRRSSPLENPVHFRLLRALRRGARNLHELAEMHQVRLPTMSRTVSVLESRNWVERTRSREDRRTVYAGITAEGRKVLAEVEEMAIRRTSALLSCMPPEAVESLRRGLEGLNTVVREELGIDPVEGALNPKAPRGCEEA
ncbi:MAG: MarR family winged helix-turn-helix transcriptional regulator [Spirochaetota bacterium]